MAPARESTPWGAYAPGQAWDEAMDVKGKVREPYAKVYREIEGMSREDLFSRAEALANTYLAQGVTFDHAGEERPFPLDIVPRVVSADDWEIIGPGVAQRVKTLEALLDDIYGSQRCVTDGVVPRRLITSSHHFHWEAAGVEPANGVRVQVSGIDVVRDQHGIWRVLEDNVRVPSGVSYVLSNRRAMSQMFSELFTHMGIHPVLEYPQRLRAALAKSAPEGVEDPTIVVLTPGVYNSAYYEHSLLARTMGVELVEGRDLEVVGGRVFMRTTAGRRRVDVIYRRVDDDFLDPVQFRPDSALGSPGLITAARLGNVTIANAVGNGVADDKLMYTYLPDLTRYYLGEEPILPERRHLAARRGRGARGGHGPPPRARRQARRRLGRQGRAHRPGRERQGADGGEEAHPRGPAQLDRPTRRPALDRPDAHARRAWSRVTSTSGPSRSTAATTCGCSPAASRASRSLAASSSSTRPRAAARRTPGSSARRRAPPRPPRSDARRSPRRAPS